jgi:hypothetical protein
MKWLSAGVTFVNFSTVCGLILGMATNGLALSVAVASLTLGAVAAIFAYLRTSDPGTKLGILNSAEPVAKLSKRAQRRLQRAGNLPSASTAICKYRNFWTWVLAACFAIFAVRSFCWLLYIDGNQLKVQSPNNLGDLALHITYIRNFASGVSLWPYSPIYVFSKLRYPAGIDLFNALLCCLHFDLTRSLVWTGLLASLATFYAFYRWGGAFGVAGFLFNGGIAGFQVLNSSTFLTFLDYQGDKTIAWKSIPLSMFVTQRGLLYAIPAGLLLLWSWHEKFRGTGAQDRHRAPLPFWVELSLYASMPLFHVHTFLALSAVLVFLFGLELFNQLELIVDAVRREGIAGIRSSILEFLNQLKLTVDLVRKEGMSGMGSLLTYMARWGELFGDMRMRKHVTLLLASALVPATLFVWLITDHFHARSVLEWHPGWVQDDDDFAAPFFQIGPPNFGAPISIFGWLIQKTWNGVVGPFFQFWLTNFGVWIPLVLALIGLCGWRVWKSDWRWGKKLPEDLVFLLPATAIFVFAFFVKTAPWGWDNLKIMIWAYFLVLPFLWTHLIARWPMPVRVAICIALFGSGFVSLLGGLAAGRNGFGFTDRAELDGVGDAIRMLPVEARFAAYPIYNHPLLLQGRKVVLGYPGHLWTEGFDYRETEEQLRKLMGGAGDWRETARHLRARYIFWGREEKINYPMSGRPWEKTIAPVASGNWGAIYDLEEPAKQ